MDGYRAFADICTIFVVERADSLAELESISCADDEGEVIVPLKVCHPAHAGTVLQEGDNIAFLVLIDVVEAEENLVVGEAKTGGVDDTKKFLDDPLCEQPVNSVADGLLGEADPPCQTGIGLSTVFCELIQQASVFFVHILLLNAFIY